MKIIFGAVILFFLRFIMRNYKESCTYASIDLLILAEMPIYVIIISKSKVLMSKCYVFGGF